MQEIISQRALVIQKQRKHSMDFYLSKTFEVSPLGRSLANAGTIRYT